MLVIVKKIPFVYLLPGTSRDSEMTLFSRTVFVKSHDVRRPGKDASTDRDEGSEGGSDRSAGSLSGCEVINASLSCS